MTRLRPLLLLILLLSPYAAADEPGAELQALRARIAKLQGELQATRSDHDRRRDELRDVERRLAELARVQRDGERRLRDSRARLSALDRQRGELLADLDGQRAALTAEVRAAYMLGSQPRLKAILNQRDPARLGRVLGYYGYLNRARSERIGDVRQALGSLRELEARIRDEEEAQRAIGLERQREAEKIAAERAERARVVAALEAEIADQDRRLAQYRADEKRLEQLVDSLQQALAESPAPVEVADVPFSRMRGRLALPAQGRLSGRYGAVRGGGPMRWQGVLIEAAEGSEVRAVAHGRVAYADWLRGYGLLLILDHGDGYMTLYGQNEALHREVGDWVRAGDPVASVGRSGGQSNSGLYFELRKAGKPVNPSRWWAKRPG